MEQNSKEEPRTRDVGTETEPQRFRNPPQSSSVPTENRNGRIGAQRRPPPRRNVGVGVEPVPPPPINTTVNETTVTVLHFCNMEVCTAENPDGIPDNTPAVTLEITTDIIIGPCFRDEDLENFPSRNPRDVNYMGNNIVHGNIAGAPLLLGTGNSQLDGPLGDEILHDIINSVDDIIMSRPILQNTTIRADRIIVDHDIYVYENLTTRDEDME